MWYMCTMIYYSAVKKDGIFRSMDGSIQFTKCGNLVLEKHIPCYSFLLVKLT